MVEYRGYGSTIKYRVGMSMINFNAEWMREYNPDEDKIVVALILAMKFGDWESVKALIPLQPDINERDSMNDWTPLMHAVHEQSLDTVKLLVEAGADVNLRGNFEQEEDFALNLAAYTGNKDIFEYLAPLTLPDARAIAERTWSQRTQ